jgi:hypothetical protein
MTGFWSWVSTCCVPLLVVAIALDPGFAPSQQAKPTEAGVDQAIQTRFTVLVLIDIGL